MRKTIYIYLAIFYSFALAGFQNEETGWTYTQSILQGFYLLESTQIDGLEIESGDVIGAFNDGVCVGWVYADPSGYTTIPLMGDDQVNSDLNGYMLNGDIAELLVYDASSDAVLPLNISNTTVDTNDDGEPDLFGELPAWQNFGLFIINGISYANNIQGCTDPIACNYNPDANLDDQSCEFVLDCAGECGGSAVEDCAGECGGSAVEDCAGECGGSAYTDLCGICDSLTVNDNETCSGCTDECADNFNQENIFDDGSCIFSIPIVESLYSISGPNKISLFWDSVSFCNQNIFYKIFDSDGDILLETYNTTAQINNLQPDVEYCFYITANTESASSLQSDIICDTPTQETGWSISLQLDIETGGQIISDSSNTLGMKPDASEGYDDIYDIPEPPQSPSQWASLYFPHPDWFIDLAENFTSDYRELKNLSDHLEVWNSEFISDIAGPASVEFNFINDAGGWPVYVKLQQSNDEGDFKYYKINTESVINFSYIPAYSIRSLDLIVGNSVPGPPSNFEVVGGPRRMDLFWGNRPACIFDEESCNDPNNRYSANGYKIFKNSTLKYLIGLKNKQIIFDLGQIFVDENELSFQVDEYFSNGESFIDCYEQYEDSSLDGLYNLGESFRDCGKDNICPDDEGYTESDTGESDGLCNRYVAYTPYFNFFGTDSFLLTINDQQHEIIATIVEDMIYEFTDESLIGSQIFNYYMIAFNDAGDSEPSLLASDVTEPNILPIADAGDDMEYFLYELGQEEIDVTFPLNIAEEFDDLNSNSLWDDGEPFLDDNQNGLWDDFSNINQSYDPDAFENENITYSWEKRLDDNSWQEISTEASFNISLNINSHYFRLRVKDITGMWGDYDYVQVTVRGLPEPAQITSIDINSNLYYLELSWPASEYSSETYPDGYSGSPFLANTYEIYYEGNQSQIAILDGEELYFLDNALEPSTTYCYEIYAVNVQGIRSAAQTSCASTGDRPSVELINPTAAEIVESGIDYLVYFDINNSQFVSEVSIQISSSSDGSDWNTVYNSSDLASPSAISIPDYPEISTQNYLRAEISDKGDYYNDNSNIYFYELEFPFTIANTSLSQQYNSGINLVGSPLISDSPLFSDNFCPNDICLSFNQDGDLAENTNIEIGQGYYLVNLENEDISISGDLLSNYSLDLKQGWNLISNPLVTNIKLDSLKILHEGTEFLWNYAIAMGDIISPRLIGFDNLNASHDTFDSLDPFKAYWIHAQQDSVKLVFEPHVNTAVLSEPTSFDNLDWKMKISASEKNPSNPAFSISDYVVIGFDEDADESFAYAEDLYDIPAILNYRFTNLYINHSVDWFLENVVDNNGVSIESPRFMSDIRKPINAGDFKEFRINGELLGPINSSDSLDLDWEMDEVMGIYPIRLIINGETIDMRQNNSISIRGDEFTEFVVQIGEQDLDNGSYLISDFKITNPYPNPFNPTTKINISIPISDFINISVYDIGGNLIEVLHNGFLTNGKHTIDWNADNHPSGLYFIKTAYKDNIIIKKAILIK